ncbi:hypothetical protein CLAIMM_08287 isoform 2 [Cladophialophora immunda]|nr:hypothetical protein CLAIMM_08287 isoform 1 [Cladophialophora immunda]OQV03213.1 hypothetical protein CLAIMM_08287 isoform 2 [Cladophialophora immunda]
MRICWLAGTDFAGTNYRLTRHALILSIYESPEFLESLHVEAAHLSRRPSRLDCFGPQSNTNGPNQELSISCEPDWRWW